MTTNQSATWAAMTEEAREEARGHLRQALARCHLIYPLCGPAQRRIVNAIEALVAEDRIILGGCLILLIGLDAHAADDIAHGALQYLSGEVKSSFRTNPEAN